jgi:hypothetical protein
MIRGVWAIPHFSALCPPLNTADASYRYEYLYQR